MIDVQRFPATIGSPEKAVLSVTLPSGNTCELRAYGPDNYSMVVGGQVNWPGIGASSVADVIAFAEALKTAAIIASRLNPTVPYRTEPAR